MNIYTGCTLQRVKTAVTNVCDGHNTHEIHKFLTSHVSKCN